MNKIFAFRLGTWRELILIIKNLRRRSWKVVTVSGRKETSSWLTPRSLPLLLNLLFSTQLFSIFACNISARAERKWNHCNKNWPNEYKLLGICGLPSSRNANGNTVTRILPFNVLEQDEEPEFQSGMSVGLWVLRRKRKRGSMLDLGRILTSSLPPSPSIPWFHFILRQVETERLTFRLHGSLLLGLGISAWWILQEN